MLAASLIRTCVALIPAAALLTPAPGCKRDGHHTPEQHTVEPAKSVPAVRAPAAPALRLALLTDVEGVLEPCGCAGQPVGGVDRVAAALAALRREPVPVIAIAAGDLLRSAEPESRDEARRLQHGWKADVLSAALARMRFDLVAPGPGDLTGAASRLAELARAGTASPRMALVSTDPRAAELDEIAPRALLRVAGIAVGITAGSAAPDPLPALTEQLRRLRAEGAALTIAVVHGDAQLARRVAGEGQADLVVETGAAAQNAAEYAAAAGARSVLLRAGRHTEGLLVMDVWPAPTTPAKIRLLADPPYEWPANEHGVVATYRPLNHTAPPDSAIRALLEQLFARINAAGAALPGSDPHRGAADAPGYVGSRTCAACHTQAYFWWRANPHGRAFEALVARNRQLDFECVGCHVTGFERPGGATLGNLEEYEGAGCESCHGPGAAHADSPHAHAMARQVRDETCLECHDARHSPGFEASVARRALSAAGHAARSGL